MQVPAGNGLIAARGKTSSPGRGAVSGRISARGSPAGSIKLHDAELPGKIAAVRAGAGQQAVDYRNLLSAALRQETLCVAQGGRSLVEIFVKLTLNAAQAGHFAVAVLPAGGEALKIQQQEGSIFPAQLEGWGRCGQHFKGNA